MNVKRLFVVVALVTFMVLGTAGYGITAPKVSRLAMGTGTVGGVFNVYGSGWASAVMSSVPGVEVTVEVTGGGVANLQLVQSHQVDIGLTMTSISYEAWEGLGWANGMKHRNVRGLIPTYPSLLHMMTLTDRPVNSIHDFEGKNISLGPPGGPADTVGRDLLKLFGIKPKSILNIGADASMTALMDGMVDATLLWASHPYSAAMNLESSHEVRHIEFSEEDIDRITSEWPHFARTFIPAGTYKHMTRDYPTIASWSLVICHKDLPEDLVYDLVKATYANVDRIIAAHPGARNTRPENIVNTYLPLHRGAYKYYQEIGIDLPSHLAPVD